MKKQNKRVSYKEQQKNCRLDDCTDNNVYYCIGCGRQLKKGKCFNNECKIGK